MLCCASANPKIYTAEKPVTTKNKNKQHLRKNIYI